MHGPMSAPMAESGPRSSALVGCANAELKPSQSPGYHSAASSPSSSSIASPVSSSSCSSSNTNATSPTSSGVSSSCSSSSPRSVVPTFGASQASGQAQIGHTMHKQEPNGAKQTPIRSSQANRQQTNSNGANMSSSLFDFFPELNYDGALLTWFHGANNRASLTAALISNKMFVSGDISLAEMSRYPVPIMARPPLGVSDMTLESWLADTTRSEKGIKLTFTSTRTVEPAFRVLARHAEHLKGPLILSADILARPQCAAASVQPTAPGSARNKQQQQQQSHTQQPVDAWTFLMLCRTRFPKSIISIGWCSAQTGATGAANGQQHLTNPLGSADSMFELDIEPQQQPQQQISASVQQHQLLAGAYNQIHMDEARGSAATAQQHALVQQLAAAAAAAQAHHLLPASLASVSGGQQAPGGVPISHHYHHNHHHHNHHHHHHHQRNHHKHLSSSGSLSSNSSGNSSGSPSPTSPLSHLSHHNHHNHHHQQYHSVYRACESSEHQLILAAAAAAASQQQQQQQQQADDSQKQGDQAMDWPAAVATAAAMVAASSFQQQQQQQDSQLPLNLNINEADPKHTLSDFARRIQTIRQQQQQQQTPTTTTSINIQRCQQKPHLALASKLISGKQQANDGSWHHINKKTALTSCLNSNSPSPISTSPKQQHNKTTTSANLLCVSSSKSPQQTIVCSNTVNKQSLSGGASAGGAQVGYTREMIDKMASLVKEYNLTQPITFPVEARLLLRNNNSLNELQRLLYQVGSNSTLTIVAQPKDLIGVEDLLQMRKHFSPQQVLFDLPDDLASALRQDIDLMLA